MTENDGHGRRTAHNFFQKHSRSIAFVGVTLIAAIGVAGFIFADEVVVGEDEVMSNINTEFGSDGVSISPEESLDATIYVVHEGTVRTAGPFEPSTVVELEQGDLNRTRVIVKPDSPGGALGGQEDYYEVWP